MATADYKQMRGGYCIDYCVLTGTVRVQSYCVRCSTKKVTDLEEPPPICPKCKNSTFMQPMTLGTFKGSWDHLISLYEDHST